MDRINSFGATDDHKFTEGNPVTGVPATVVSAKFLNDIQEEMCNFVESAGLDLDADDQTQFEQAARILAAFTPKGSFVVSEKNPRTLGVEIASGFLNDGVNLTYVAPQSTTNLTPPVSNPRYDLIVIDAKTGAYSIVQGTENASPSLPAVPAGKLPLASVLMQTTTTEVVYKTMINDLRALPQTGGPIGVETSIASASSTNLGSISGRYANITGTTTITNFGTSLATGRIYFTRFAGALTLTNGGNLATSTGANIITTAGDFAIWRATSATAVTMVGYFRANGTALVSPSAATDTAAGVVELATSAEVQTGTDTGRVPSVATMAAHKGVAKAWAKIDLNGNILDSYGISSVTKVSGGNYQVNWTTAFANANYATCVTVVGTGCTPSAWEQGSLKTTSKFQYTTGFNCTTESISDSNANVIAMGAI